MSLVHRQLKTREYLRMTMGFMPLSPLFMFSQCRAAQRASDARCVCAWRYAFPVQSGAAGSRAAERSFVLETLRASHLVCSDDDALLRGLRECFFVAGAWSPGVVGRASSGRQITPAAARTSAVLARQRLPWKSASRMAWLSRVSVPRWVNVGRPSCCRVCPQSETGHCACSFFLDGAHGDRRYPRRQNVALCT
ncbi:hypothetical protein NDU88_007578 [Pleurodeles waltl]|uniref:Uncharacterized protein n=1 Tax=Pleurodeles waltl TaxID=8319 RepID=A0AAV7VQV9_PLEWA|nr:hypothetical protein NDU88_007578 [Pleurodeles waltl]